MPFSLHKRYEIVFLHQHPKGLKLGLEKTASYIGCSKSIVIYWVKRYQENKDLSDQKKSGQGHSTSVVQNKKITTWAENEYNITVGKI